MTPTITITKLKYRLAWICQGKLHDLCGKRCPYSYRQLILNSSPNIIWDYLQDDN